MKSLSRKRSYADAPKNPTSVAPTTETTKEFEKLEPVLKNEELIRNVPIKMVFEETDTPHAGDFSRIIANLALNSFHNETIVDEAYLREFLVSKVKNIALEKGFRIKMPYADRLDKFKTRTINFYCHMSKSANRKLGANQ